MYDSFIMLYFRFVCSKSYNSLLSFVAGECYNTQFYNLLMAPMFHNRSFALALVPHNQTRLYPQPRAALGALTRLQRRYKLGSTRNIGQPSCVVVGCHTCMIVLSLVLSLSGSVRSLYGCCVVEHIGAGIGPLHLSNHSKVRITHIPKNILASSPHHIQKHSPSKSTSPH